VLTEINMHCKTIACRKHKGVVGWLCTKLEGSLGKLSCCSIAACKYCRISFDGHTCCGSIHIMFFCQA
jgi:hypothetical protein